MLVVPLLRESLLPGETRPLDVLGVERELAAHLATLPVGTEVCAVTVASAVEVPTLLGGRFGTVATIAAAPVDEAATPAAKPSVLLHGLRRARITAAKIESKRVVASLGADIEPERFPESLAEGAALLRDLSNGAVPEAGDWQAMVVVGLASIARAACPPREQGALVSGDLASVLARMRSALHAARPAHEGAIALEALAASLPPTTESSAPIPEANRRRLWAQIVEIQRKLDLYDIDKHELGSDLARLVKRLSQAGLRDEAKAVVDRELRLLRGMESSHHDYSTVFAHLDLFSRLPWHPSSNLAFDVAKVRAALDASHSGLERVKTRILEYLAVKKLGGTGASTILCLGGPPGVGKTTIAKAIADALGRPFVRVALGGVHDESEIRGHRRTFTAATAGRIVSGMTQSPANDPVMLLDEIDKIGTERGRSPTAALLEVLDPAQHSHFVDNFLAVPYDLSNVLFLCTANDLGLIHPVLRDRLEIVELDGYTIAEKVAIAQNHLVGSLSTEHGVAPLDIPADVLGWLVERYTREGGVRELRRVVARLYRSRALALVEGSESADIPPPAVTRASAEALLGPPRYRDVPRASTLPVGVAIGLATSQSQGSLLRIEVATVPADKGKGDVVLTGSLGNVMKESARTVLGLLRATASQHGLASVDLSRDIYVHLPDAATPKDGPSAGCALFAAMLSAFTGRPVHADVAITGELSLTGEVLAVGGIREKVAAAERAGMRAVVVPEDNRADVPKDASLEVVYVTRVHEVVGAMLATASASEGNGAIATRKGERTATKAASTTRGKRASRGAS